MSAGWPNLGAGPSISGSASEPAHQTCSTAMLTARKQNSLQRNGSGGAIRSRQCLRSVSGHGARFGTRPSISGSAGEPAHA
eukprot:scaffold20267_cov114-Isochrysis_galbana.AAC.2